MKHNSCQYLVNIKYFLQTCGYLEFKWNEISPEWKYIDHESSMFLFLRQIILYELQWIILEIHQFPWFSEIHQFPWFSFYCSMKVCKRRHAQRCQIASTGPWQRACIALQHIVTARYTSIVLNKLLLIILAMYQHAL